MRHDPDLSADLMENTIGLRGDELDALRLYKQSDKVTPEKLIRDIERIVVHICRYGRQSYEAVDRMSWERAALWVELLSEIIKAESGSSLTNNGEEQ